MWTVLSSFNSVLSYTEQWRIQGGGAPLFVDQTVARRAQKDFQTDFSPPLLLSQVLDDRSLTLSEGLDPPLLKHAHCM